jgi:hypothetical protein
METALSSWKEIAQYVGKGVRTVQRWEREAGLPVRRQHGEGKGKVLAFPQEIDGWMHSAFTRHGDATSELSELRRRVEQLLAENRQLRHDLSIACESLPGTLSGNGGLDQSLLMRCAQLLHQSARTRQEFAQLVATQSAVSQACADTMQTLKHVRMYQFEDVALHGAD